MRISFDANLCTGCKSCELACSGIHTEEFNPARSRIRIDNDPLNGKSIINVCRACKNPACVKACTYGACRNDPNRGVICIDYNDCVGCYACVEACPFHANFIDPVDHVPIICDGCGGNPVCVKFCYKQAIYVSL